MLQMNKSVSPRPSLSNLAGVLIPISVLIAMGICLIIGLVALAGNISYAFSSPPIPTIAAPIADEAPDISEQIVRW